MDRMIPYAVGSFFAGFLTCYWLVRQPESSTPANPPLAMLKPVSAPQPQPQFMLLMRPVAPVQQMRGNGYMRIQNFDTGMPALDSGYYDLFDRRHQPDIDVNKLK